MRPRLRRPFCVSMLAVAGLLVVSYFPLSGIRAANAGATILTSAGKPLVNLKTPQNLKLNYAGSADAVASLQAGSADPTALAAADFDADGAMDVVAGYSAKNGGLVVLMRGNPDAFAPTDLTLYGKAAKGNVPPTFLPKAAVFAVPESPDLIATGDFNRDGYKDVLVAARGSSNLYLLAGDGHGNLLAPQAVPVLGQVRAFAVTPDGHLALSLDGPSGSQLAILAPSTAGLTTVATYPLPARGDSVEWGSLGGGADVAVGAGSNIVMIYSALTSSAQTETVTVPFQVQGLVLGDFIWDRDGRTEISVLADDGSIHILQHGTLNTTPLTAAEIPARRAAIRGHHTQPATPPNPTALGAWTLAKQIPYTGSAPTGPVSHSAFNSPRLAGSSTHDLMVLDAAASQLNILDTSGATASPSAGVSFTGTPVAALALPQTIDARRGIVVLAAGQAAPVLIPAGGDPTFTVTTTADEDDAGACTNTSVTSGTGGDGVLSLREAICEANNNAPSTSTINIGNGTYSLTSLETGELQVDTRVGYNLTINGTGTAAGTVIQQTDGHDRIFEADFALTGNNPFTIQNVTLHGGNCTTGTDCNFSGGAILAGSFTGDNLTLTNVVMSNNGANPTGGGTAGAEGGGAIEFDTPPNLTITNSAFSSNTASGAGGAIEFKESGNGGGNLSVTNSSFTGNTAVIDGGGLSIGLATGFTATISGSTFTGNSVTEPAGTGGAISETFTGTTATITVSNSRFVGNSAPGGGTGAFTEAGSTGTLINNWWGCNAGPGNTGCDSVINGTFDPWLVLGLSASPSQIDPAGASTLTADLTHNSNGTGGFSVPNGVNVTFAGGSLGSVNPTSTTFISGTATSTFTAGSSAGDATPTATVDNATANTTVNILDTVVVATSPSGLLVSADGSTPAAAPQTFHWVVGSSHTIATSSPQNVSGGSEQVFTSWSDGTLTTTETVTSAPAAETTYTANFTTEFQLTTGASPSNGGTVTPASGSYFAGSTSVPVTATPNANFRFNNWTTTGAGTFDSTTNTSTNFHMPSAATSVTGNFVATSQITVTTSPANLLVSVDGGTPTAAPLVETWDVGSTHIIATSSPQSGGTGVQYVWSSWSDGMAISHTIAVPPSAATFTATFNTQYQLTTQASPSADGSVTPASGSFFAASATIPVTATANTGFQFVNWTSTGGTFDSSTSASTNFHMPGAPATVTGNFTVVVTGAATTTSVSSNNNPSFTAPPGNSVTFTATVSSTSTVNEGTVTFTDGNNNLTCSGGNPVAVSNGTAQCTTSFTTEGTHVITGAYNGTVNFQASSGTVNQAVNNHTVVTGNQFCNQGAITVPSTAGAATPYPSNVFVSGFSGNIGAVTVQLNNIGSSDIAQTDMLLVGPTGAAIVPFAAVGDGSTISGINITLDDTAASLIPGGSPLTSGTYKPTSITGSTTLVFPAPAPSITGANYAATDGAATLTSQFGGTAPNGTWSLYGIDNSGSGAATIGGGWCVNITPATVATTITTSPANLLVSVDGGTPTAAPLTENWVPSSTHTIATSSPQNVSGGSEQVWSSWSDGGAISHGITVPSSATTYTANFNTEYQLTTQSSPSADGSVTPASGSYYVGGATIPVTATANAGFQFNNWTSTGGTFDSSTSASTNFHMPSASATVTGNFVTAAVGDFRISATPPSETIAPGHSASYTITLTSVNGLTGSVSLSCSGGNPPHSTCSIIPNTLMLNDGTAKATVMLTASQQVNHGTFTLTFTGTKGSLTHSTQVTLKVK